jgi:hypothetical protein
MQNETENLFLNPHPNMEELLLPHSNMEELLLPASPVFFFILRIENRRKIANRIFWGSLRVT